ncbi:hypothetical protein J6590_077088 [Homalodisca vitripennis]|nr:hypothetical protein J6590_077088 [Homalodisca vitripennis]
MTHRYGLMTNDQHVAHSRWNVHLHPLCHREREKSSSCSPILYHLALVSVCASESLGFATASDTSNTREREVCKSLYNTYTFCVLTCRYQHVVSRLYQVAAPQSHSYETTADMEKKPVDLWAPRAARTALSRRHAQPVSVVQWSARQSRIRRGPGSDTGRRRHKFVSIRHDTVRHRLSAIALVRWGARSSPIGWGVVAGGLGGGQGCRRGLGRG